MLVFRSSYFNNNNQSTCIFTVGNLNLISGVDTIFNKKALAYFYSFKFSVSSLFLYILFCCFVYHWFTFRVEVIFGQYARGSIVTIAISLACVCVLICMYVCVHMYVCVFVTHIFYTSKPLSSRKCLLCRKCCRCMCSPGCEVVPFWFWAWPIYHAYSNERVGLIKCKKLKMAIYIFQSGWLILSIFGVCII